ncbi:MoaD/ThiS family protein [Sporomusa sp. KB1]|jgi:hypothetical protein|uniref:MoaD/ThiS family protein n=1 Tax=Sporomusa sp. KB1 TaxID=943346 RepID=UPI0011A9FAB6|nr:MoaD/ThiS family protein [Sporomusa sp. KB1]TWH51841.1 Mut7-C ubiquitin [Sporomusa sp. KB1]
MSEQEKSIEVRAFIQLSAIFKKKNWPMPLILEIERPISGTELAEKLEIPLNEIEIIFINGRAQSMNDLIQAGDRVAFVPPGCPGPYRIHLGFYGKHQDNN